MIQRAACYLLVPVILFQGMCSALAGGSTFCYAKGQEQTPHFHLRASCHHDQDDSDQEQADEQPRPANEHQDDDAVYVPALVMLSKPVQGDVGDLSLFAAPVTELSEGTLPIMASAHFLTHSPPMAPCPIYLQVLSLLI